MLGTLTLYQKSWPILGQKNLSILSLWVQTRTLSKWFHLHKSHHRHTLEFSPIIPFPIPFPFPPDMTETVLTWFLVTTMAMEESFKGINTFIRRWTEPIRQLQNRHSWPRNPPQPYVWTIQPTITPITYTTERTTSQTFSLHRTYTSWLEHYTELSMIHCQRKRTVTLST